MTNTVSDAAQIKIVQLIAKELGVGSASGRRCCRAARRRFDRALHRALSQGGHRQPGRHAPAQSGRAPALSARAGRAARGDPGLDRGAGQTHRRTARDHRGSRHQASAGRSLSALQAQAPHTRADCARGRAGAAGRCAIRRSHARSGAGGSEVRQRDSLLPKAARPSMFPTPKPRSMARAIFFASVLPRPPSCSPNCVRACGSRASLRPR